MRYISIYLLKEQNRTFLIKARSKIQKITIYLYTTNQFKYGELIIYSQIRFVVKEREIEVKGVRYEEYNPFFGINTLVLYEYYI